MALVERRIIANQLCAHLDWSNQDAKRRAVARPLIDHLSARDIRMLETASLEASAGTIRITRTLYTRCLVVSSSGRRASLRSKLLRHAVSEKGAAV